MSEELYEARCQVELLKCAFDQADFSDDASAGAVMILNRMTDAAKTGSEMLFRQHQKERANAEA